MHVVDSDNYEDAGDAIKDILMLYYCLVNDTGGFSHNADCWSRFEPLKYVDAKQLDDRYYFVDMEFLRTGSAISIVCFLYNLWWEEQNLKLNPAAKPYVEAVESGRLAAFPDIEETLNRAIGIGEMKDYDLWFDEALKPIYEKYVLAFFRGLATPNKSAG